MQETLCCSHLAFLSSQNRWTKLCVNVQKSMKVSNEVLVNTSSIQTDRLQAAAGLLMMLLGREVC